MELTAPIEALKRLKKESNVIIYTDSQYVQKGITEWIHGWKKKGWKNSKNEPVKNADLWKELEAQAKQHKVTWQWVKGHSNHIENDRADALARKAVY
jgi:ribonuclease HI